MIPPAASTSQNTLFTVLPTLGAWQDRAVSTLATGAAVVLDLGDRPVDVAAAPTHASLWWRVGSHRSADLAALLDRGGRAEGLWIAAGHRFEDVQVAVAQLKRRAPSRPIAVEVLSRQEAEAAMAAGATMVVCKGLEAGGFIGEESISVLTRACAEVAPMVVAWGGAGPDSVAALKALGACGAVLADALMLASDAPTGEALRKILHRFDPRDTRTLGRQFNRRLGVFAQLGTRPVRALEAEAASLFKGHEAQGAEQFWGQVRDTLADDVSTWNPKTHVLALGQEAALARHLMAAVGAEGTTADLVSHVQRVTAEIEAGVAADFPLQAGAGICRTNGTVLPIHQGPMAQTSDVPAFAEAVARAGAMPWLALANMPTHVAEKLMVETAARLGDLPWGAGIIGLEANPYRDAHIELIKKYRPQSALVAAGTTEQAQQIENFGVPSWLHTPTPNLVQGALAAGATRLILEGSEAGGHVGTLGGLLLWQLGALEMMAAIDEGVAQADALAVTPAGGIGDARSAAAAATVMWRLHRRGVAVGVQMGTAYLMTEEIVSTGALTAYYQTAAMQVGQTVLMGESVRTPTRVLDTPQATRVLAREVAREVARAPLGERKSAYEHDNLGGLRAAAKGQKIDKIIPGQGALFCPIPIDEQQDTGLFHIGQGVALVKGTTTMAALHHDVTEGARAVMAGEAPRQQRSVPTEHAAPSALAASAPEGAIAIVGVGCCLPDALTVEQFWRNLIEGHSAIGEVPESRWSTDLFYNADPKAEDRTYSRIGGFVRDFKFDRKAFRLPPKVVSRIDVGQQWALEATRQALTDAGLYGDDAKAFDRSRCAVILGNAMGGDTRDLTNFRLNMPRFLQALDGVLTEVDPELGRRLQAMKSDLEARLKVGQLVVDEDAMPGELSNIVAGRVAQVFDLHGPNFTTDAACASSMAALQGAIEGLRSKRFDIAVSGGVDSSMGMPAYVKFSKIGALSATGSRPFDAGADGFVMGEGAAVLVLKRLDDAITDGDQIYAVIRGIGGSSDGKGKGITAPNPRGQALALRNASEDAGVSLGTLQMVEAHGTSTRVGDRTEVEVLTQAFTEAKDAVAPGSVALGSVKSMLGHLKGAAGAAGVLKTALALYHETIPPSLNFERPNEALLTEGNPFSVPTSPKAWAAAGTPRRAGVSAFGFGGTNFHVILEEAPRAGVYTDGDAVPSTHDFATPSAPASMAAAEASAPAVTHAAAPAQKESISMTSAQTPAADHEAIYARILEVLCTRTGYDADEIEPDFELEADLGIDTVKQAEIMAEVRKVYGLPRDETFKLADYPTLQAMTQYVVKMTGGVAPASELAAAPTAPATPAAPVTTPVVATPAAPEAPVAADPVAANPVAANPAADNEAIYARILEVLCTRTGYDADEIEPDFELEADLGIDTVKQAEIMAEVRKVYGLPRDETFKLADYPTLQAMTQYVVKMTGGAAPAAEASSAPAATAAPVTEAPSAAPAARPAWWGYLPVTVTADRPEALDRAIADLLTALGARGEAALEDARRPALDATALRAQCRLTCPVPPGDVAGATKALDSALNTLRTGKGKRVLEARGISLRLTAPSGARTAFLFPGQGSQYTGMLSDLRGDFPVIDEVLAEADKIMVPLLGHKLSTYFDPQQPELVIAGERRSADEALRQTQITQPAMLTADIAMLRVIEGFGLAPDVVAGHSLGEYAACVAAGMLALADGLQTVSTRGTAMAQATPMGGDCGLMAAIPAGVTQIQGILDACSGYVIAANKNSPAQTVIAGSTEGVQEALAKLAEAGFDGMLIPVSHAFHSEVVASASVPLTAHLKSIDVKAPAIPVLSNVTAEYFPSNRAQIIDLLGVQVARPVEFIGMVERMYADGVRTFVEIGPKRAQTGFVNSILGDRPHRALCTNHPKFGGPTTLRTALAGAVAEGIALQPWSADRRAIKLNATAAASVAPAPMAAAPAPSAPAVTASQPTVGEPVVVSGLTAALPGRERLFTDEDPFERILNGENLISEIPEAARRNMANKAITRLVKNKDGGGELVPVDNPDEMIHLAGQLGDYDLIEDFGVPADLVKALDRATGAALGCGLDVLRDAGLPMIPHERVTRSGRKLKVGWRLPEVIGDRTGVIFASAFAGEDVMMDELSRHMEAQFATRTEAARATLAERMLQALPDAESRARMQALIDEAIPAQDPAELFQFNRQYLVQILGLGASRFAEFVGARGPNLHMNIACASTTGAVAIANDWIAQGRADRVVILGADDVTRGHLLEWVGSGFLAVGAATNVKDVAEGALPFDARRNGMIVGGGAVALLVEKESEVRARGMCPVAEVVATHLVNSAMHPTRLDVDHVAREVGALMTAAEARKPGLDRHEIASKTVFMSHETYTPARGGSAAAEIEALRRTFGDAANSVVIANTKGFSGHPMGAGIEDAVVLKGMQRQKLPPIANFKVPDPTLGDLRLSQGGPHELQYALRLAAGFGSQLALVLYRAMSTIHTHPNEDRVDDRALYRRWVGSLIGADQAEVEVVKRVLRVLPMKAAQPEAPAPTTVTPGVPAPQQVIQPVAAAPAATAQGEAAIYGTLLEVLCERTGYDADEVEPEFELEADLGIDTVKQAEIMAEVRKVYGLPRDESFKLADYPTLKAMTAYVIKMTGGAKAAAPAVEAAPAAPAPKAPVARVQLAQAPAPAPVKAQPPIVEVNPVADPRVVEAPTVETPAVLEPKGIERRLVTVNEGPGIAPDPQRLRQQVAGRTVALVGGPEGLTETLAKALAEAGARTVTLPLPTGGDIDAWTAHFEGVLSGVTGVIQMLGYSPVDGPEGVYRQGALTFALAKALRRQQPAGGFFITLTSMGGRLGFGQGNGTLPLGGAVAGVTKSLSREWAEARVRVIDLEPGVVFHGLGELVLAEAFSDRHEVEVGIRGGQRFTVRETALSVSGPSPMGVRLNPTSVILITGGAGGITARIAGDIARRTGARLALVGRTALTHADPRSIDLEQEKARIKADLKARGERATPMAVQKAIRPLARQQEIAGIIDALKAEGAADVAYFSADTSDGAALETVVREVRQRFGRIDGVIHGAGVEISRRIEEKPGAEFDRVFRGKALGGLHLWRLTGEQRIAGEGPLSFFVTFSSVAGRYGNAGQADYSAANEVLNKLVAQVNAGGKAQIALSLDWTAWDEVGMAVHGSMKQILTAAGVELLPPEVGAPMVGDLLESGIWGEVVIAGRLGQLGGKTPVAPPVALPDLSRSPFLDAIVRYTPGQSLEASRTLDLTRDHCLRGHIYDGVALVPGVIGMEMMAEAARALFPRLAFIGVDDLDFAAALKLHRGEPVEVRVDVEALPAVEGEAAQLVKASVRSVRTNRAGRTLEAEHFRSIVRLGGLADPAPEPLPFDTEDAFRVGPDQHVLYQRMFHSGVFEVITDIPFVGDKAVICRGRLPGAALTEGGLDDDAITDPLVREMAFQTAGLWGIIWHKRQYLPLKARQIRQYQRHLPEGGELVIRARLIEGGPEKAVLDVEVVTLDGRLIQRLHGLEMIGHRPLAEHEILNVGPQRPVIGRTLEVEDIRVWMGGLGKIIDDTLTPEERAEWARLRHPDRRMDWLAGRMAAKSLVCDYVRDFMGQGIDPERVQITRTEAGQPVVRFHPPEKAPGRPPALTISHSSGTALAVLALSPNLRPGVDIERVQPRSEAFIADYFTEAEAALEIPGAISRDERITALWALKEAVTKALGTGLAVSTSDITIESITPTREGNTLEGQAQISLKGDALRAYDALEGQALTATVTLVGAFARALVCLTSELPLDPPAAQVAPVEPVADVPVGEPTAEPAPAPIADRHVERATHAEGQTLAVRPALDDNLKAAIAALLFDRGLLSHGLRPGSKR
ncbi:MAG: SDR family NAD(P)-dependent oxidoreductase [Bradymonadia bacterium]